MRVNFGVCSWYDQRSLEMLAVEEVALLDCCVDSTHADGMPSVLSPVTLTWFITGSHSIRVYVDCSNGER